MNDKNISFGKESWWQTADPWIEVLHRSSTEEVLPYFFKASKIDHLESIQNDLTRIVLQSGEIISILLPSRALAEKIDRGLSPLDLKEYCLVITDPAPGDRMEDGTIFAGISPNTGRPMYATPADAPLTMTFNEAAAYARELKNVDKKNFHVPTMSELNILYQNREKGALRGTFNTTGSGKDCEYWSSEIGNDNSREFAETQDFGTGEQHFTGHRNSNQNNKINVRCVRS